MKKSMTLEHHARQLINQTADAAETLGFESDGGGLLLTLTSDKGSYVLHWHAPTQQLWFASPTSGASHYAFDGGQWRNTRGGGTLHERLSHDLGLTLE